MDILKLLKDNNITLDEALRDPKYGSPRTIAMHANRLIWKAGGLSRVTILCQGKQVKRVRVSDPICADTLVLQEVAELLMRRPTKVPAPSMLLTPSGKLDVSVYVTSWSTTPEMLWSTLLLGRRL